MIRRVLAVILCFGSWNLYADSKTELECLAKNIYFEARSESYRGQFAVAFVTLNRVQSNKFPNSICGVVYQADMRPSWSDPNRLIPKRNRCQFSWYCDGLPDEIEDHRSYETAIMIAKIAIHGVIFDNTHGSLFYHNHNVDPYWNDKMQLTNIIGQHIFYRIN